MGLIDTVISGHFTSPQRLSIFFGEPQLECYQWVQIFRSVESDTSCRRCGAIESAVHVLFSCPFAQTVWNNAPLFQGPDLQSHFSDTKTTGPASKINIATSFGSQPLLTLPLDHMATLDHTEIIVI